MRQAGSWKICCTLLFVIGLLVAMTGCESYEYEKMEFWANDSKMEFTMFNLCEESAEACRTYDFERSAAEMLKKGTVSRIEAWIDNGSLNARFVVVDPKAIGETLKRDGAGDYFVEVNSGMSVLSTNGRITRVSNDKSLVTWPRTATYFHYTAKRSMGSSCSLATRFAERYGAKKTFTR